MSCLPEDTCIVRIVKFDNQENPTGQAVSFITKNVSFVETTPTVWSRYAGWMHPIREYKFFRCCNGKCTIIHHFGKKKKWFSRNL